MARVTIYQGGQIQDQGTTTERLRPADFGANVGQGLQAVGAALKERGEYNQQIAERSAEDEARQLDIEHMQTANKLRQSVYSVRGEAAAGAAQDAGQELRDSSRDIMGQASSPLARRLLERSIATRNVQETSTWSDYATGQAREAGDNAVAARASTFRDTAADFPIGSPEAQSNLAAGENEVRELGRRQGADPAATDQRILAYRSQYHATRVDQLFHSDNIREAQAYIDTHRGEMTAEQEESSRQLLRPDLEALQHAEDGAASLRAGASQDQPAPTGGRAPAQSGASNDNTDLPPDQAAAASNAWHAGDHPPPPPGEQRWQAPLRIHSTTVPGGQYGAPRSYGGHVGHDYAGVPAGTPVYPMASGVAHVSHSPTGGNIVRVDYGPGYYSRSLHLQDGSIPVRDGQQVGPNDIIGRVGDTGTASHGAHLHQELYTPHGRVDPSTMFGQNSPNTAAPSPAPPPDGRPVDLASAYRWIAAQPWTETRRNGAMEWVHRYAAENDNIRQRSEEDARRTINGALDQIAQSGGRLTSLTQLPADALRNAPPGMMTELQATIRAAANASPPANSPLANSLIVQAADDPNGFLRLNPETYRGRISNEEVQWMVRTQTEIQHRTGPQPNEILSVIRWNLGQSPEGTYAQGAVGVRNDPRQQRADHAASTQGEAEYRRQLEGQLLPAVQARLRATHGQGVVRPQDIQDAVQAEMTMVRGPDGSTMPMFRARQQGAGTVGVTIPNRAIPFIDEALRRAGSPVTPNNRSQLYMNHRAEIDAAIR